MSLSRLLFKFFLCLLACVVGALLTSVLFNVPMDRHVLEFALGTGVCAGLLTLSGAVRGSLRKRRYLDWLRHGASRDAPRMKDSWEEMVDVSQRVLRSHEQTIRSEQDKLNNFLLALQASPNGVLLLDADDRIAWFNQTAATLFGLQSGRDEWQIISYLIRDPVFVRYLQSNDYEREVELSLLGGGRAVAQQISVQCHHYGEGKKLLLARDVTQIVRAEAMRRDFVANVSHEIRTPLTVLNGFVETMQHTALSPEETTRFLVLMSQQGQRMKSLVDDLLTLSRLESAVTPGHSEWIELTLLLQQCEQEASTLSAGHHQVQCVPVQEMASVEIAGVSRELISAFSNLVSNAVRYTPEGGQVSMHWSMEDTSGCGVFSVTDTGSGIAAEHIARLTERFYRVDRSRSRETGGTGLGLAIVKHVVQRHGGELLISSQVGKGSTFSIRLPASRLRRA